MRALPTSAAAAERAAGTVFSTSAGMEESRPIGTAARASILAGVVATAFAAGWAAHADHAADAFLAPERAIFARVMAAGGQARRDALAKAVDTMDRIDQGQPVPELQDVAGYAAMPETLRQRTRARLEADLDEARRSARD